MYYKCELLIRGYIYPITDLIRNWEDITASFKRDEYNGVIRTFTDKFEFVKGARTLLLNEYKENYLNASASIVISTRNNSWTWVEQFRCPLNFSTLTDDGNTVSINGVDSSVAALIKAKKGTQYEYPVLELAEKKSLDYDHLVMLNNIKWENGGQIEEGSNTSFIEFVSDYHPGDSMVYSFPLFISSSELYNKNKFEAIDTDMEAYENMFDVPPFFTARDRITARITFGFTIHSTISDEDATFTSTFLRFGKINQKKEYVGLGHWDVFNKAYSTTEVKFDEDVTLEQGESLVLGLVFVSVNEGDKVFLENPTPFEMSFYTRGNANFMQVIKPSVLLNRLLESMDEGKNGLQGVIIASNEHRLDNAMLLAAESVRLLPNAKIYTSFSNFSEWMKSVFGYVYDINENVVTFRHRNDYFKDKVVKRIENFSEYSMNINSSLIYSQLNVGYPKKDYDSLNGKDEFRFTNQYTTGITLTDNKLELISPYRADAYGIEFLSQKIGEDTTDNSSDTDVFFVCVNEAINSYELDRSLEISGVINPESMFNAMYAPSSFILSSFSFLGSFISRITFASSDGNSLVKIAQNRENRNVEFNKSLISATNVEIETSDIELPDDMTGLVEFDYQGQTIQGYYMNADFTYTRTKSCKIGLVLKR